MKDTAESLKRELARSQDHAAELRERIEGLAGKLAEYTIRMTCGHPRVALDVVEKRCEACYQKERIVGLERQLAETTQSHHILAKELREAKAEIEALRKIAAHVPGAVYIKAKEEAGYGGVINAARGKQ